MAYSSVFLQRARELGIEVSQQPVNALLVCKRMLENQYWKLNADQRKIVKGLDELERELREVIWVLDEMQHPKIADDFIRKGYVSSVEDILHSVQETYSHVYAALTTREEGGNTDQVHFAVSQRLFACRKTLGIALQRFFIE